jgi:putative glutamine amidotransferase
LHHALHAESIAVNSMHHQGIKQLGRSLAPSATAPDGLIEAIESCDDSFLVGVQWHPEVFEANDPNTEHLFTEFLAAARSESRRSR